MTRFRGNVFGSALRRRTAPTDSEQGKFAQNAPGWTGYVENADSLLRLG